MTPLRLMGQVLWSPRRGLDRVASAPVAASMVPLVMVLASALALAATYFNFVDISWLRSNLFGDLEASQQQIIADAFSPVVMMMTSVLGNGVVLIVSLTLTTLYLFVVGKLAGAEASFGRWWTMVTFASTPQILLLPIGLIALSVSTQGQILPGELNPTTLNQLVFRLPATSAWSGLLESVSLISLWSLALIVLGASILLGGRVRFAVILIVVPTITLLLAAVGLTVLAAS